MPAPISPQPTTPTFSIAMARSGLVLDHHRNTLPAADAGGGQAVAPLATAQLVGEGEEQARARGGQGMAEGDGAPVDVRAVAVESELLLDGEVLAGEGLVHLHEVDVLEGETRRLQRL